MIKRKLQVFISSTFSDLQLERQAAVSAVLKSGHIPAGMELFKAADKSQMKTIEQWIDESDLYMLILGGRYGSIEPLTQLSYTELEYDYAVSIGKPTFSVVITSEALETRIKNRGSEVIEKTNQAALELFRKKVLGNISSFFSDEKDVKLCVYESLSDYAGNPDLKGWVSAVDVQDSIALNEEIMKLRDENLVVKEELAHAQSYLERKPGEIKDRLQDFKEIIEVLKSTEVTIPGKAMGGGADVKSDLLSVLLNNKDFLISGVTNQYGNNDAQSFLYFNVLTKLQVHELAINEKIAGVTYRRSVLSKKGLDLISYVDREAALSKKSK